MDGVSKEKESKDHHLKKILVLVLISLSLMMEDQLIV